VDTTAAFLTDFTRENTQIVGLAGKPSGHCGFGLPIVKHLETGLYCVLSLTPESGPVPRTEPDIRRMREAGDLTLFPTAIKLPRGWTVESARQPVVAWFSRLLAPLVLFHPKQCPVLSLGAGGPFVFCADQGEVEKWAAGLAARVQTLFDAWLAAEPTPWTALAELAEGGLQAARADGQRYWLDVRRCVALYFRSAAAPELAYQAFREAVEPTCKGVTWERFFESMRVIHERAKSVRVGRLDQLDEAILRALLRRQGATGEPMEEILKSLLQRLRGVPVAQPRVR
jgi:hypothetical protein